MHSQRTARPKNNIRELVRTTCRSAADFEAFCLDCFPDVFRRFPDGMDRVGRENLLIQQVGLEAIEAALLLWAAPSPARAFENPNPQARVVLATVAVLGVLCAVLLVWVLREHFVGGSHPAVTPEAAGTAAVVGASTGLPAESKAKAALVPPASTGSAAKSDPSRKAASVRRRASVAPVFEGDTVPQNYIGGGNSGQVFNAAGPVTIVNHAPAPSPKAANSPGDQPTQGGE